MLGSSSLSCLPYSDELTLSEINKISNNKKLLVTVLSLIRLVNHNQKAHIKLKLKNNSILRVELHGLVDGLVIIASKTGIVGKIKISDIDSIEIFNTIEGEVLHG